MPGESGGTLTHSLSLTATLPWAGGGGVRCGTYPWVGYGLTRTYPVGRVWHLYFGEIWPGSYPGGEGVWGVALILGRDMVWFISWGGAVCGVWHLYFGKIWLGSYPGGEGVWDVALILGRDMVWLISGVG